MRSTTFALFLGIAYLSLGLLGLIPAMLSPAPPDAPVLELGVLHGYLLGLLPVNVLHSAVHLAIAGWGLVAWHGGISSRKYARAIAIIYGVLAVIGLFPVLNTLFGMLPLHGNAVWLHGATATLAAYFGWRPEPFLERRSAGAPPDRRKREVLVAHDRRVGHADRRLENNSETA